VSVCLSAARRLTTHVLIDVASLLVCVRLCVRARVCAWCACVAVVQWNYVDFIVVVGGFLSLLPGVGNFSALRIIRVLRPLRTLNRLKGLRVIVVTLMDSMKALGQVVILVLFLFTIYAIVGLQVGPRRRFDVLPHLFGVMCVMCVTCCRVLSCVVSCAAVQGCAASTVLQRVAATD
jgi:hypothetical protein